MYAKNAKNQRQVYAVVIKEAIRYRWRNVLGHYTINKRNLMHASPIFSIDIVSTTASHSVMYFVRSTKYSSV